KSAPKFAKRTAVVLDESGAVGIDDMRRLFDLTKHGRLILCGDTGQHGSVARGDALRLLEEHSDFQFGQLTRIHRQQRADYRRAVEFASKGHTMAAFAQLERMGALTKFWFAALTGRPARPYLWVGKNQKRPLLLPRLRAKMKRLTSTGGN